MGNDIKISNPQEVREKVLAEALLLKKYDEDISQEAADLNRLESVISDAEQIVAARRRGIIVAIEQIRSYEDSQGKQDALRNSQKMLEIIENQGRTVNQCKETMLDMRSEMLSVVKRSNALSDNGSVLASKIQKLLDMIIEAM